MVKLEGIEEIRAKLAEVITKGYKHEHYHHTVEVAKFWHRMVTGTNHDDYIVNYRPREEKEAKDQRIRVYNDRTKFVLNRIRTQIKKGDRVDFLGDEVKFPNREEDGGSLKEELQERLEKFAGTNDAKEWLNYSFRKYNEIDPNAFLIVNYTDYDNTRERTYTRPEIVASDKVIDFKYDNNILQYLIISASVEVQVRDMRGVSTQPIDEYTIIAADWTVKMRKEVVNEIEQHSDFERQVINNEVYKVKTFDTKSKYVNAYRFGYIPDEMTGGATYESIFSPAKSVLLDLIQKKSELDIDLLTHGIIQKFAYVPPCNYEHEEHGICHQGTYDDGTSCKKCGGTGKKKFHTSSQDIVTMELKINENAMADEIVDLSKMVHYAKADTEIIQMHMDLVKQLETDVSNALFNVDVFTQDFNNARTAEEIRSRNEALNNVLYEYCTAKASMYRFIIRMTAIFMDIDDGLMVNVHPPTDFKLETLDDLISQLEKAENSPRAVKDALKLKMYTKLNQDNPENLRKIVAKDKFRPFQHLTESERMMFIDDLPDDDLQKVLYLNFDRIMLDIDNAMPLLARIDGQEQSVRGRFYELRYDVQKAVLAYYSSLYIREATNTPPQLTDATE